VKAASVIATPRPLPNRAVPAIAGGAIIALSLPVFLVAGWRVSAWALAAVLWGASHAFTLLLARLKIGMANLASSGVVAFGMMFRTLAVVVVLAAVAASDAKLALAAALVYALVYTFELALSLVTYFGAPAR
jgi:hypothetical protein